MLINLYSEIASILDRHSYTFNDIAWVGTVNYIVDTNAFLRAAKHTTYDNGYGSTEVPRDMIIVMKDNSWFSRREYDGSEWFTWNCVPSKPAIHKHLKSKSFIPFEEDWWDAETLDFYVE